LKIQGREYAVEIMGEIVKVYRELIDIYIEGKLSNKKFEVIKYKIGELNKERENIRKYMTSQLHKIILAPSG
jgi:collagenase-like PrtC family protease